MTTIYATSIGQSNDSTLGQGTPSLPFSSYDPDAKVWNSHTLSTTEDYTVGQLGSAFVHPSDLAAPANIAPGKVGHLPYLIHKMAVGDPSNRTWRGIMSPRGGFAFETDWWNASGRQGACLRFEQILIAAGLAGGTGDPQVDVLISQGWEMSCNNSASAPDPDAFRADFRNWHTAMVQHLVNVGRLKSNAYIVLMGVHPNAPGGGDRAAWNSMIDDLANDYVGLGFNAASLAIPSTIAFAPTTGVHWDAAGQILMGTKLYQTLINLGI